MYFLVWDFDKILDKKYYIGEIKINKVLKLIRILVKLNKEVICFMILD